MTLLNMTVCPLQWHDFNYDSQIFCKISNPTTHAISQNFIYTVFMTHFLHFLTLHILTAQVKAEDIDDYAPNNLLIVTTGSQVSQFSCFAL